ncbi:MULTISPECIES: hypothetical protein [Brucella]|uniref:hypothetical protein n=1 Tax=Brucella TaxID=234 RepID=UPI0009501A7B
MAALAIIVRFTDFAFNLVTLVPHAYHNTSAILAIIRPMAIPSYTFTSLGMRTANRTDQSRVPTRVTRVPWLDGEMAIKCLQNPF